MKIRSATNRFKTDQYNIEQMEATAEEEEIRRRQSISVFSRTQGSKSVVGGNKQVRYNFKAPDKFQNAPKCFICERKFTLSNKRHHCRLCGKSVTAECSKQRIDGHRVCDVCFMKHSNQQMEIQKKNYLRHLANWTKDLDKKIATLKTAITEKESKRDRLNDEINSSSREMSVRTEEIERSIDNLRIIYESKERERKSLEDAIRNRKELLNESNLKLRDLESQITIMELNLQMQESNYNMKVDRKNAIKAHLEDLKASEQNLKMTIDDEEVKIGLIDELLKKSIYLKEGEGRNSLIDATEQEKEEQFH